jgi:hypothetical protein
MRFLSLPNQLLTTVVGLAFQVATAQAQSTTPPKVPDLEQIRQVGPYLSQCVQRAMAGQNHLGQRAVTFGLSFRSDGRLLGMPLRTFSFPPIAGKQQQRFADAVNTALIKCAPLPFSKALGEAIAGRKFNYRHTIKPRQDIGI